MSDRPTVVIVHPPTPSHGPECTCNSEEAKAARKFNLEDWHGCFTGDCPHETQAECDEEIKRARAEEATQPVSDDWKNGDEA
jgi:hypothetical protein